MSEKMKRGLKIGDKRCFMTGAFHYVGEIVELTSTEVWLDKCSFIDELGPLDLARAGTPGEKFNSEFIGDDFELKRFAYLDSFPWDGPLPLKNIKGRLS